jgi:hypothetical protein
VLAEFGPVMYSQFLISVNPVGFCGVVADIQPERGFFHCQAFDEKLTDVRLTRRE